MQITAAVYHDKLSWNGRFREARSSYILELLVLTWCYLPQALLPTRRWFNTVLDDSHLVVHCYLSSLAKREKEGHLFCQVRYKVPGKNFFVPFVSECCSCFVFQLFLKIGFCLDANYMFIWIFHTVVLLLYFMEFDEHSDCSYISWSHRMAWVGRYLKDHPPPTPLLWTRDTFR